MKNITEKEEELRNRMKDRLSAELNEIEKTVDKKDWYNDSHNPNFYDLAEQRDNSMKGFDKLAFKYYQTMKKSDDENMKTCDPLVNYKIFSGINSLSFNKEYFKTRENPVYQKLENLGWGRTFFEFSKNKSRYEKFARLKMDMFANRTLKKEEYEYILNNSLKEIKKDIRKNNFS